MEDFSRCQYPGAHEGGSSELACGNPEEGCWEVKEGHRNGLMLELNLAAVLPFTHSLRPASVPRQSEEHGLCKYAQKQSSHPRPSWPRSNGWGSHSALLVSSLYSVKEAAIVRVTHEPSVRALWSLTIEGSVLSIMWQSLPYVVPKYLRPPLRPKAFLWTLAQWPESLLLILPGPVLFSGVWISFYVPAGVLPLSAEWSPEWPPAALSRPTEFPSAGVPTELENPAPTKSGFQLTVTKSKLEARLLLIRCQLWCSSRLWPAKVSFSKNAAK